jgi:acyl-CoA thioester hydrolase
MNNSTYLALYEEARWDWLTADGYGLHEIQKVMQGPVILDIHIKFLKEIHLREKTKIISEMLKYEGKIATLRQQMIKENGDVACEAIFTFALFDMKLRKIIEPTDAWKKALGLAQ